MRLPSTQALKALESFDRHGSIWQAADELNLTRSAVSHQLRLLERELGFQLMEKVGTRAELTRRGKAFARDVRGALRMLTSSAERNATMGMGGTIVVSSPPGFATAWLCPNIGDFHSKYPDIAIKVETPRRLDDTSNPAVDVFVTFGTDNRAGILVELLQQVEFTPLCSPAYLNQFGGFAHPRAVKDARLLHISDHRDWEDWFDLLGLPLDRARTGVVYSDMNMVYVSALAGQGLAMGDRFTCKTAIEAGQLVQPFDQATPSAKAYYLATPEGKLDSPAVTAFRDWVKKSLHNF